MAWFLKLAVDRDWIGPGVRIVIGIAVAVALFFWSERFRRHDYATFSYTLKALGTGIAYLSLWASYSVYHLLPGPAAFAAMLAVTGANAFLSLGQTSELLAGFALIGGLATPALLSTGQGHELFLFSYLLLLDAGALLLSACRPWPRLAVGAFTGTTMYIGFGWPEYSATANLVLSGTFVALFFALFTAAPWLALRRNRFQQSTSYDGLLVGLPVAVGACAFVEGAALVERAASPLRAGWSPLSWLSCIWLWHSFFARHAARARTSWNGCAWRISGWLSRSLRQRRSSDSMGTASCSAGSWRLLCWRMCQLNFKQRPSAALFADAPLRC